MLPKVFAKYFGRTFKLNYVIIKEVGGDRITFAYLKDENGDTEVAPMKKVKFFNSADTE
tara:strand:+ start:225 stop:401 length:177 start_codon:yes stop_codon:yes gene_type:complete